MAQRAPGRRGVANTTEAPSWTIFRERGRASQQPPKKGQTYRTLACACRFVTSIEFYRVLGTPRPANEEQRNTRQNHARTEHVERIASAVRKSQSQSSQGQGKGDPAKFPRHFFTPDSFPRYIDHPTPACYILTSFARPVTISRRVGVLMRRIWDCFRDRAEIPKWMD